MHPDCRPNEESGPCRRLEAHAKGREAAFPAVGNVARHSGLGGMGAEAWLSGRSLDRRAHRKVEGPVRAGSCRGTRRRTRVRQKTMADLVAGTSESFPPRGFGQVR